ncbi:MAG: FAD-dependent oxidoreductase, partial [Propionibacteriaceae bacterium]|nr:FAD-dependent oxidoreductase [Propionibacteriaceae bacterium]
DGWQLVWTAAASAREHGARVLTYHRVTSIERDGDRVCAVVCTDDKTGEQVRIDTNFVLNCGGPWSGRIAASAGCHGVDVVAGAGIMVAFNHRLVNTVVNRCIHPADGDILVPVHTVSIIGTTDTRAEDPDHLPIPREEVQQMLDAAEVLVPGARQARAVHAWAGARPLVKDARVAATDTRHMSRGVKIIDHAERDGLQGFLTIAGGKLTTYRLMAEHLVNAMEDQLGTRNPCRTAEEACPTAGTHHYTVTHRLADAEADRADDPIICECELMSRSMFVDLLRAQPRASFDDLRRQLRLGMGPCQGGFCCVRAAGIAHDEGAFDVERSTGLLRLFLANRWLGLWPILYGEQARQAALDNWIMAGTLDIEHLPVGAEVN